MDALMIGVSGMRGTVGGTLTPAVVSRMAGAFAVWLSQERPPTQARALRVVFGRDSRPSGTWVRDAAVATLVAAGVEIIDLGIVTTPGVAMMSRHLSADGAVIATASHNPIQWNGLKLLNSNGAALPSADSKRIGVLFGESATHLAAVERLIEPVRNTETHALHVKRVLEHVDVLGISSKRFKTVLDSVNGAGCVATATLMSKLGCQLVHINNTPDGRFPHDPE
ncbi:MAG: phosphoglucosamine mutase, partial [Tepidisphaeraceae bacterium]